MTRSLTAANEAILDDAFIIPVLFVNLDFDSDPLFVHTDLGTITTTTPAGTWTGLADLGTIGTIQESVKPSPYKVDLVLSVVDESAGSIYNEALNQNHYQRDGTIYLGFRNAVTGAMVADPDELFHGRIDDMRVTHGGATADAPSFVTVTLESELADFKRSSGKVYSNAQLQSEFAGDTFFRHVERFVYRRVPWGSQIIHSGNPILPFPTDPGDFQDQD